jgi:hypothetical protein
MDLQLAQAKFELEQAQAQITKYKDLESRYYANIEIDNKAKESRQLEIFEAQKRAADAQTAAAEAQTLATQSQLEVL